MVIRLSQDYRGAAQVSFCWPAGLKDSQLVWTWAGLGSREHLKDWGARLGHQEGPLCGRGRGFGRFVLSVSAEGGHADRGV